MKCCYMDRSLNAINMDNTRLCFGLNILRRRSEKHVSDVFKQSLTLSLKIICQRMQ